MPQTILLLGSKGMLGTDVQIAFENDFTLLKGNKQECDIRDKTCIEDFCTDTNFDWVINCAAYTDVDGAEQNERQAFTINADSLFNIISVSKKRKAKILHISTDYVFDGQKEEGYLEDDEKNPINTYGASKAKGEDILLELYPEGSYIIRTAWLYGDNGKNFVHTMLRLAQEKENLSIVNDQFGSPTSTKDLAIALRDIITSGEEPGIYHRVNDGQTSWYDFALEIFKLRNIDTEVIPVTSEEFLRPAKRPKYSILRNTKLPVMRHWQEALQDFLSESP